MESRHGFLPKPTTRSFGVFLDKDTAISKPIEFAPTDFAAGESKLKTKNVDSYML